jgi:lipopolysaccharide export system protein LptC
MSWRGMTIIALFAGALLVGWMLWSQRHPPSAASTAISPPDYILNDFELIALDADGRESFTLRAPRLERDPDSKTLDIVTPLFIIPPAEGSEASAWEVRSKTGWVSAEGDEIRLRGEVQADSKDAAGRATRIASEKLDVFPEDKRAVSPGKVTVTRPGLIMNGNHLVADLARNQITLKDTRSRYENTAR